MVEHNRIEMRCQRIRQGMIKDMDQDETCIKEKSQSVISEHKMKQDATCLISKGVFCVVDVCFKFFMCVCIKSSQFFPSKLLSKNFARAIQSNAEFSIKMKSI